MITHVFLQHYWWIIVSLLASMLVFLMFVQGGQTFIYSIGTTDIKRKMIVNTLGRKWEFTFTTLVTFGGAFFASFPLFYATSFGGAYWLWMAILFSFIIQAIAYEYRSKPANVFGTRTYDTFLLINGSLGPFLIGTAVATFFTGSHFVLDPVNKVQWQTQWHGLEALTDIRNLSLGFSVLFIARVNGLLFIVNTVDNKEISLEARKKVIVNSLFFLVFFLYFVIKTFVAEGYSFDPQSGLVFTEKYKYLFNFIRMPLLLVLFAAGVTAVIYGIASAVFKNNVKAIWITGPGTIITVFSLFLNAGFGNTAFYPSVSDLQSSLTIFKASSSHFTLKTMMYISFIIPFVIAYIWYAWRVITTKRITPDELKDGEHTY